MQKLHAYAKQNTEFIHYFTAAGRCLTTYRNASVYTLNSYIDIQTPLL